MNIEWKPLGISLLLSMGVGAVSGFLTRNAGEVYSNLALPAGSPPSLVFPIVWTILFLLMGISAYLIYVSDSPSKKQALLLYLLQLGVNFIWPLLFFSAQLYGLAFLWLVLLWILVAVMIIAFYKISPIAAYLQIPYLLWLTYAGYLNLGVYLLNR